MLVAGAPPPQSLKKHFRFSQERPLIPFRFFLFNESSPEPCPWAPGRSPWVDFLHVKWALPAGSSVLATGLRSFIPRDNILPLHYILRFCGFTSNPLNVSIVPTDFVRTLCTPHPSGWYSIPHRMWQCLCTIVYLHRSPLLIEASDIAMNRLYSPPSFQIPCFEKHQFILFPRLPRPCELIAAVVLDPIFFKIFGLKNIMYFSSPNNRAFANYLRL